MQGASGPRAGGSKALPLRLLVPGSWLLTSVTDRVCSYERIPIRDILAPGTGHLVPGAVCRRMGIEEFSSE